MQILGKHYKKHLTILYLISIIFLCPSVAQAEFRHWNDWTKKEQALYGAYSTLTYIDIMQTRSALNAPCNCYREANPIFGNKPHMDKIYLYNALAAGLVYWGIGASEPNQQNRVLLGVTGVRLYAVYHNHQVGISWTVAF